ncbi:sensor histidine kinase with ATPase domain [Shewanella sediminis HAW-EB3]|uniref:histidine kinase n=1 Tax=Shewanella sediminis (strain HAW-EB3) TaxID=425104 RepID=A8FYC8_SHESH|nr:ATP-binding protein [Shewanella sediminis]ABV37851.1 sensor histidine kinase with ATPase domain [Shewanella sediminis HAW-EB3]
MSKPSSQSQSETGVNPNKGLLNSLKARLVVSALLLILVLLPLIGFTLNDAFKQQVKSAAKNELSAYLYSVLAVTEVDNNRLLMPELLVENQFNVIQSGLYALISTPGNTSGIPAKHLLWQSNSFLASEPPQHLPHPATGQSEFGEILLEGKPHIIYSFSASFEQRQNKQFPITIHIIKDQADFQLQIDKFTRQLWTWLLILMALLGGVQLAWLLWTLKPLAKFKQELSDVEQGRAMQLEADYPTELQAVARQLNTLLNTEQSQRKRYRNALSDLAHSLKTPLAVIQSQKDLSQGSFEQISVINRIIGHQLKRAQSAAGSSWHLGVKVCSVSEKLVRTLGKIYRAPEIQITESVDSEAIFKGDESDLTEILGNLLDNACKAAKSKVLLSVTSSDTQLNIAIEDDGNGISPEQQSQIFERGIRADSYSQGHGIGLAIVRDLIDSYNGKLSVSTSESLGGAKFEISFSLGRR